ncbi:MAG: peptidoglycan-binding protein [Ilumatobacter sp.]|nr:peptidoglycan-binding protein [Ilumatobacter sp.]
MHEHQRTTGRRRPTIAAAEPRADHPITELQQTVGNQAVQRLLDGTTGPGTSPPKTGAMSPFAAPSATKEAAQPAAKQGAAPQADVPPGKEAAKKAAAPPAKQGAGPAGTPVSPLVSARFAGDPDLQACRQGQRLFRWGSEGGSVATLQQALIDLGYPLPEYGADGSFGGETHTAVIAYQRDAGLGRDGIIGTNTIGALDASILAESPPTTPPGVAPPGTEPPGTEPPQIEPPGTEPPGTEPPGHPPLDDFHHADLQAIWLLNSPGTAQQRQAFEILDVDTTGPWQHVQWNAVRAETARRVFDPNLISQETLSVCGPATIAHMQADLAPAAYAAFVRQVFETATIDGDTANDDLLANVPAGRVDGAGPMDQVDWMLLSCMRDTENAIVDFDGNASDLFSGITMPGEMAEWMEEILGCVETEHYTSYLWGEVSNAETVSNLMRAHGDGVVVAMLVDHDKLQNRSGAINIPDHWIRLLRPIDISGDQITVHVYTWGAEYTFNYDEDGFEDVLFEFVVGALQPGISL